ncbi:hypothetical protein RchiOBHm_Chr2g0120201 [Rosa chinensis]|uniref:Uncharacterized protein n=1 Tax=Rosa chinensis TaxID=74649 RepID=A0A2P6RS92_ROSCH|nr:hypothetical protein RchiOBHm_Chr2g0120201 [Rosa chinensis]
MGIDEFPTVLRLLITYFTPLSIYKLLCSAPRALEAGYFFLPTGD